MDLVDPFERIEEVVGSTRALVAPWRRRLVVPDLNSLVDSIIVLCCIYILYCVTRERVIESFFGF